MTSRPKNPISWVDSFWNILTIEESRGFDNKAVLGGLDRFIQTWAEEMAAQIGDGQEPSGLLDIPYSGMTREEISIPKGTKILAFKREPELGTRQPDLGLVYVTYED